MHLSGIRKRPQYWRGVLRPYDYVPSVSPTPGSRVERPVDAHRFREHPDPLRRRMSRGRVLKRLKVKGEDFLARENRYSGGVTIHRMMDGNPVVVKLSSRRRKDKSRSRKNIPTYRGMLHYGRYHPYFTGLGAGVGAARVLSVMDTIGGPWEEHMRTLVYGLSPSDVSEFKKSMIRNVGGMGAAVGTLAGLVRGYVLAARKDRASGGNKHRKEFFNDMKAAMGGAAAAAALREILGIVNAYKLARKPFGDGALGKLLEKSMGKVGVKDALKYALKHRGAFTPKWPGMVAYPLGAISGVAVRDIAGAIRRVKRRRAGMKGMGGKPGGRRRR